MNKIKKDIVAHIQKHHKKYIFGTGVGFGLVIVKIIAISGVLLGMTAIVSRSNTINNENEEIFQAITVFNKMDDLLHQRCPRTHQLGLIGHVAGFDEAEKMFHNAKNLNEKFRAAALLNEVVQKQDEFLHKMGGIEPEEDEMWHLLDIQFHAIK